MDSRWTASGRPMVGQWSANGQPMVSQWSAQLSKGKLSQGKVSQDKVSTDKASREKAGPVSASLSAAEEEDFPAFRNAWHEVVREGGTARGAGSSSAWPAETEPPAAEGKRTVCPAGRRMAELPAPGGNFWLFVILHGKKQNDILEKTVRSKGTIRTALLSLCYLYDPYMRGNMEYTARRSLPKLQNPGRTKTKEDWDIR